MATPRKHWWRVADSVGREPWSNDVAAAFLRLGCHLNTCWARDGLSAERAGRCVLSFGDLMGITGKNTIPACAEVLTRLSEAVSMEFELRGAVPLVYFARRSDALIKIGQTTNWPQRHRQLVREFGPIELLGAIGRTDCRVLEKRLHRELAPHRIAGEWFREEPAVSDWIARGQPLDSAWTDPGTYLGLPTAIVSWPNWPRFQALTRNESPSKSPVTAPVIPPPQDAPARRKTQDAEKKNGAAAPARDRLRSEVRKIWPRCVESAAKHGRRWETLSDARLTAMAARAKEHGGDVEVLLRAIDGAISYWRASAPEGTDPARNLTPETLYRPANFPKYLEAVSDPKIGHRKPISEMTKEERLAWMRENGQLPGSQ